MNLYEIATTFEDGKELHQWFTYIHGEELDFAIDAKVGHAYGDDKRMLMLFVHEACKPESTYVQEHTALPAGVAL